MIKNILGRIFAAWALFTFIATFLIIYLPSMLCWLIPGKSGQAIFIAIAKGWMSVWLTITGCRFAIKGKENFKSDEAYIVTCNHNALLDVPLSSPFIPGANKTIAKSTFTKVPLFGFYYMKGAILVNRKSDRSRRESFDKMKTVLKQGMHMCIYPEGTRNRSNEPLKKFHDGAFKLATATGNAVIPAVILNTKKVMPIHKTFFFWPQRIEMHFLPAIASVNITSDELKQTVFKTMWEYYNLKEGNLNS